MDLAQYIITLLTSATTHAINFVLRTSMQDILVYPEGYGHVADCIRNRHIRIVPWSRIGVAKYQPGQFPRELNVPPINTLPVPVGTQALIIHECTHALADWHRLTIPEVDNEVAAYVAQAWYCMSFGAVAATSPNEELNNIFRDAVTLADAARSHRPWPREALGSLRQRIMTLQPIDGIQYGARSTQIRTYYGIP